MTNEELRSLCERVIGLDSKATNKGKAWWVEGLKVHSSQAIICDCSTLLADEFEIERVFTTASLISEYRNIAPDMATECLKLLAQCEAMRGALRDISENWDCRYVEGDMKRGHSPCQHCKALEALSQLGERT